MQHTTHSNTVRQTKSTKKQSSADSGAVKTTVLTAAQVDSILAQVYAIIEQSYRDHIASKHPLIEAALLADGFGVRCERDRRTGRMIERRIVRMGGASW